MSVRINNAAAFVTRNRNVIKTAVILGLILATAVGMALDIDAVALAGSATGGTY